MTGKIKVFTGCMYSGKTGRLLNASYEKENTIYFKPYVEGTDSDEIYSREDLREKCVSIPKNKPEEIKSHISDEDSIVIDEVQFFETDKIVDVVRDISTNGIDVLISGLDKDFRGDPFDPMPQLLAVADDVVKLKAVCEVCGEDATISQRLVNGEPVSKDEPLLIIGSEQYQPRCRKCHIVY